VEVGWYRWLFSTFVEQSQSSRTMPQGDCRKNSPLDYLHCGERAADVIVWYSPSQLHLPLNNTPRHSCSNAPLYPIQTAPLGSRNPLGWGGLGFSGDRVTHPVILSQTAAPGEMQLAWRIHTQSLAWSNYVAAGCF